MVRLLTVLAFILVVVVHTSLAQTWVSMGLDSLQIGFNYNANNSGDVIYAQGQMLYVGTNKGLLRTENGGSIWERVTIASNLPDSVVNALAVASDNGRLLYVSIGHPSVASFEQSSNLYKSTDGGGMWRSVVDSTVVAKANIADIKVSPLASDFVVALHRAPGPGAGNLDQIFKSTDGGLLWTSNSFSASSHGVKISIGVNPMDTFGIYATGDTQFDLWFYESTNWGVNWSSKSNLRDIFVQHIHTDLRSRDTIYVTCGDARIYISRNGGDGWEQNTTLQKLDPPYRWVYQLTQHPLMRDWFFAATNDGIWISKDNLASWISLGYGLPAGRYYDVFVDSINGYIYTGGDKGLFRLDPLTNIPEEPTTLPTRFQLYQSFPNPFNPTTTIKYMVPEKTFIKLVVYDLLGKEVVTLSEGVQNAGVYGVVFNASDLQSGIYFYRLITGEYTETKKMVLLK